MRILFQVGGPAFHPVAAQAATIGGWLAGQGHELTVIEGNAAFDALEDTDLLVLMGLHWTGQPDTPYVPLQPAQREAFARHIARGRPLLAHHGAIASHDDWPEFGALTGFRWVWGRSDHAPFGTVRVRVTDPGAPLVAGVEDFSVEDELYHSLVMDPLVRVHAVADWRGRAEPMVCTLQGRTGGPGGRAVYLANGHDGRAFAAPALRRLWCNAVAWLAG